MHRIQDDGGDQGIASGRSKQFCGASSSGAAHGMNQPPTSTDPSTPRSLSLSQAVKSLQPSTIANLCRSTSTFS